MEIRDYLKLLFKNKWLILALTLAGFCVAIIYNQNISQKFKATTFIYVTLSEKPSQNESLQYYNNINDFSDNLMGLVNGGVIKVSNAKVVARKIAPQIITLNSNSTQGGLAADALREAVNILNAEGQKLISQNQSLTIKISNEKILETKDQNKKLLNILIGIMAGLLAGISLVGLKNYFS